MKKKVIENKRDILTNWLKNNYDFLLKYKINIEYFTQKYLNIFLEKEIWDYIELKNKKNNLIFLNGLVTYLRGKGLKNINIYYVLNSIKEEIENIGLKFEKNKYEELINYCLETNETYIKELKLELEKLLELLDSEIIMSKTDKKGNITFVSSAFCNISGYTKEELLGKNHNIVRHKDMSKKTYVSMWKKIQNGEIWTGEFKNIKKNGEIYWVDSKIFPELNKLGEAVGYTVIRKNITNKKMIEQQSDYLREQSKNAAVGEMISMIAHQWRQPLQIISMIIQQFPLDYSIDKKVINGSYIDEKVEKVVNQLKYMSKTIDDFRDFLKPNKDNKEITIKRLIEKTKSFIFYSIKNNEIKLNINYKNNEEQIILVNENEVVQALINIIKNSIDVLLEKEIEIPEINIEIENNNNEILIKIEDNGGGIPLHIMEDIFLPYFSTKSKNGTGLGLYMCKKIIEEQNNGELFVKNSTVGVVFNIIFKKLTKTN